MAERASPSTFSVQELCASYPEIQPQCADELYQRHEGWLPSLKGSQLIVCADAVPMEPDSPWRPCETWVEAVQDADPESITIASEYPTNLDDVIRLMTIQTCLPKGAEIFMASNRAQGMPQLVLEAMEIERNTVDSSHTGVSLFSRPGAPVTAANLVGANTIAIDEQMPGMYQHYPALRRVLASEPTQSMLGAIEDFCNQRAAAARHSEVGQIDAPEIESELGSAGLQLWLQGLEGCHPETAKQVCKLLDATKITASKGLDPHRLMNLGDWLSDDSANDPIAAHLDPAVRAGKAMLAEHGGTLADYVTYSRLGLIALVVPAVLMGEKKIGAGLAATMYLTDYADGKLARASNEEPGCERQVQGRRRDEVADKLANAAHSASMVAADVLSPVLAGMLWARDWEMNRIRQEAITAGYQDTSASRESKFAQALTTIGLVAVTGADRPRSRLVANGILAAGAYKKIQSMNIASRVWRDRERAARRLQDDRQHQVAWLEGRHTKNLAILE